MATTFAGITVLGSIAHLVSQLSVEILPSDDDTPALEANNSWRIIEGMPMVFAISTIVGLLTLVRHDTPKFYLYSKDKESKAKSAIHKMYVTNGNDRTATSIAIAIK